MGVGLGPLSPTAGGAPGVCQSCVMWRVTRVEATPRQRDGHTSASLRLGSTREARIPSQLSAGPAGTHPSAGQHLLPAPPPPQTHTPGQLAAGWQWSRAGRASGRSPATSSLSQPVEQPRPSPSEFLSGAYPATPTAWGCPPPASTKQGPEREQGSVPRGPPACGDGDGTRAFPDLQTHRGSHGVRATAEPAGPAPGSRAPGGLEAGFSGKLLWASAHLPETGRL